ncbi:MAG: hypothetical protein HGN29_08375 [Asgard group archaeon]|nr:hypothetical protein [Asgard group archaeon]
MNTTSNIYENKKTYLSLAGSGDPWSYLTKTRKDIINSLHDRIPLDEVANIFNMSLDDLLTEIKPLSDSSLVKKEGNEYLPTFLIVNLDETKLVYEHSKEMGKVLADHTISKWSEIDAVFEKLSISENSSLKDQAFMLVGSRILDIGLLGELVKDGNLLKVAPLRSSLTRPDAQYYFWMIEGELKHLGKYGQEEIDLPWSNWYYLNFGQSWLNGQRNEARDKTEKKCKDLVKLDRARDSLELAELLEIPLLNEEESKNWLKITEKISKSLLEVMKGKEESLKLLFQNLESSRYTNNSFGEFICWYTHLAYPWAIDFLIEETLINIPSEHYSELIIHRKEPDGLLTKL